MEILPQSWGAGDYSARKTGFPTRPCPKRMGRHISDEIKLQFLKDLMRKNSMKEKCKAETEDRTYETDFKLYLDQRVRFPL